MKLITERPLYFYKSKVFKVKDGDTIVVDYIDLGFELKMGMTDKPKAKLVIRFARMNAYETSKRKSTIAKMKKMGFSVDQFIELGRKGKQFVIDKIDQKEIILHTSLKKIRGGFGRILADIYYETPKGWVNLNDELVKKGLAYYQTW